MTPVASSSGLSMSMAPFGPDSGRASVVRPLGLSLLLHLCVLLILVLTSWKTGERPIGSAVQVSLISLPPAPKTADTKSQAKPVPTPPQKILTPQPKVELPKPVMLPTPPAPSVAPQPVVTPPPVATPPPVDASPPPPARTPASPLPTLPPAPVVSSPPSPTKTPVPPLPALPPPPMETVPGQKRGADNPFRGALKNVELPKIVPKFGELSPDRPVSTAAQPVPEAKPQRVPDRTRQDINSLLSKLKVPEQQRTPLPPPVPLEESRKTRETALDEDYKHQLDRELQKLRQQQPTAASPTEFKTADVKTSDSRPMPQPAPAPEAAATPSAKVATTRPDMTINVPGAGPGSNAYLARVQQRISSFWQAPPVDLTADSFLVVVRFRLARSGAVTSVVVEQSSGNEYYDLAAKRAVLNADPLPPFPKDLQDPYYDAHFSFVVGGQTG